MIILHTQNSYSDLFWSSNKPLRHNNWNSLLEVATDHSFQQFRTIIHTLIDNTLQLLSGFSIHQKWNTDIRAALHKLSIWGKRWCVWGCIPLQTRSLLITNKTSKCLNLLRAQYAVLYWSFLLIPCDREVRGQGHSSRARWDRLEPGLSRWRTGSLLTHATLLPWMETTCNVHTVKHSHSI